jgi:Fibronectin type III domain
MPDLIAPKSGKIGGVDKKYVYAGVIVFGGILVVVYFRSKSQAAASQSSSAMVTDPAGNQCAALDPNSGYCPGTAGDEAYQQTLLGTDSASSVGGQVIGYDQYGDPIYSGGGSSTAPNTSPGTFTSNAEWSQAALQYFTTNDPGVDTGTISAALGAYITGQPVTADQQQLIEQAIAFEGYPPVGGTNGYPPSIKTASAGPPPTGSKPGAPSAINISATTAGAISVSWRPGTGATSYTIGISPAPKGGTATAHNIGARTQYNISGLQKGTSYTIRVTSVNSVGSSAAVSATHKES